MRVPISWLSEFIKVEDAKEVASLLTMAGLEVTEIEKTGEEEILWIEPPVNRGDCLSILGIARELCAIKGEKLSIPPLDFEESKEEIEGFSLYVEDPSLCQKYIGRIVKVEVFPSPLWLSERLRMYGINSLNNVVDVTNYTLVEWGQPLHAFDAEKIEGKRIIVRRAEEGEEILLLDRTNRKLSKDILVIADEKGPIAIAGIMGGERTCVKESTKYIFLECAFFSPQSIKRSAKTLNIETESSLRFKRGIDKEAMGSSISRALHLLQKICNAKIYKNLLEYKMPIFEQKYVKFRPNRINRILGTSLDDKEIEGILKRLGFSIKNDSVIVPTFRHDIEKEEDLAEEVARIYGYERIPEKLPKFINVPKKLKEEKVEEKVKNILIGCGFNEVVTYSLIEEKDLQFSMILEDEILCVKNPLGKEEVLTPSLLPPFLKIIDINHRRGVRNIKIFEMAKVFRHGKEILERKVLSAAVTGEDKFYTLSSVLRRILEELKIEYRFSRTIHPSFHPGKCAQIRKDDELIGIVGEIHPDVKNNYKLKEDVCLFEIDWEKMIYLSNLERVYKPLPRYPAIKRDVSFLIKEEDEAQRFEEVMKQEGGNLLEEIRLFDVYKGNQIPSGYRSLTYTLIYRDNERTLKEEEVEVVHQSILEALQRLGAKIR